MMFFDYSSGLEERWILPPYHTLLFSGFAKFTSNAQMLASFNTNFKNFFQFDAELEVLVILQ